MHEPSGTSVVRFRMARVPDSPRYISKRRKKRRDKRDFKNTVKAYTAPGQPDHWTALCPTCFRWHVFPKGANGDKFECPNPGTREPKALLLLFYGPLPRLLKDAFENNSNQ